MSGINFLIQKMTMFFLVIVLPTNTMYAASEKIEIQAKSIESIGDKITARSGVVVRYNDTLIHSSVMTYNKATHLLILDGDVESIGYKGVKEHSSHMVIDAKTKEVSFQDLFLVSKNDVWIMSKDVKKKKTSYKLGASLLSSCDISNPLWTMRFSDSNYNQDENYITMHNAKVYMWDIPVFYSPYLAFSTNRQRSSGVLFPLVGYNAIEGFVYEQPLFWAISPNVDMEFNPQIRTSRSTGLYSTLRFVDSNHSKGVLRVGYFKERNSYLQKYKIPNGSHYGFEFNYESDNVFQAYIPNNYKDGLYVNTTYLNDVDYLTLQKNQLTHFGMSPLQESRINYFTSNNDNYFGLNTKYFIDTRANVDKAKTVQILPSIQMHKYTSEFLTKNIIYGIDFKVNNFDRRKGVTMKQAEMKFPLEYTNSFFDDFVNFSLGEEFYYSKFYFENDKFAHDNYQYYSNIHKAKIFTDLIKNYDSFTHVLQPSLSYLRPGLERQFPIKFSKLDLKQKELFTVGLPEQQYIFSLNQYFYDQHMKLKFYQRLAQKYYINRGYKFADLSNEMQYNFDAVKFYNIIGYSHEFKTIRFASNSISYNQSKYNISFGHSYKKVLPDDLESNSANDINFDFEYNYNKKIAFSGGLTYDIDDAASKQWKVGGSYHQDCWSFASSVRQDIRPSSAGSISQTAFYVQLNFTPFGSIGTDTLK